MNEEKSRNLKIVIAAILGALFLSIIIYGISSKKPNYKLSNNDDERRIIKIDNEISKINRKVKVIDGFVNIADYKSDIIIDLKYRSYDNIFQEPIYKDNTCILRTETAEKLIHANEILKSEGYGIKILDGYRPLEVEEKLWNKVKDARYVIDPKEGGTLHNRGVAIDVTLVDLYGIEQDMPSEYGVFNTKASRRNGQMSDIERENLDLLTDAMIESGFSIYENEWWHYYDNEWMEYKNVEVDLEKFKYN